MRLCERECPMEPGAAITVTNRIEKRPVLDAADRAYYDQPDTESADSAWRRVQGRNILSQQDQQAEGTSDERTSRALGRGTRQGRHVRAMGWRRRAGDQGQGQGCGVTPRTGSVTREGYSWRIGSSPFRSRDIEATAAVGCRDRGHARGG